MEKHEIKLNNFGRTFWLIRPDDAKVLSVFVNIDSEIRRRLDIVESESHKLQRIAICRNWIIIELINKSGTWVDLPQQNFELRVRFNEQAFNARDRLYFATITFVALLQDYIKHPNMPIIFYVYRCTKDKFDLVEKHQSSNAEFGKLFIVPYRDRVFAKTRW